MAEDVGNSPFQDALQDITGDSWLDDLARISLAAADAKFYPEGDAKCP